MVTYGGKYINTVPQLYYCIKLTTTKEGRTMLINSPNLRTTLSRMIERIEDQNEFMELMSDEVLGEYMNLLKYWKEDGSRTIFGADELYT